MPFLYQMNVASLPPLRQEQLISHIRQNFGCLFDTSRLQEYERVVVYQDKGQLYGLALVRPPASDSADDPPTLECVSVATEQRRKGIGSEVVQFALTDLGLRRLRLHVDRVVAGCDDTRYEWLCAWYQRLGFVVNYENEKECELEWRADDCNWN